MGANDTILIGAYKFTVLKRDHSRILLYWIDSVSNQPKERWVNLNWVKALSDSKLDKLTQ